MHTRTSIITGLILAVALVFGGYQAAEARGVFQQADCPAEGNWCAVSRGGDKNCKTCCANNDSVCAFYSEDPSTPPLPQGCICA